MNLQSLGRWIMSWTCAFMVALLVGNSAVADDKEKSFTFEKDSLGKVPAGWKEAQTGKGKSAWKVVADDTAPSKSGFALAQTTADLNALFNLCVADDTNFKDVEVSVAFKANKGEKDQGGGIV